MEQEGDTAQSSAAQQDVPVLQTTNTGSAPQNDMSNDKLLAIVAYIIFFVPLLVGTKSPFVRFHTNQGTILFIASVGVAIASIILAMVPFFGWIVGFAAHVTVFILWIMGIIHAAKGEMEELPLIGGFKIIS